MDLSKITKILPYSPLLAVAVVGACAGVSIATYEAPVMAVVETTSAAETTTRVASSELTSEGTAVAAETITIPPVEEAPSLSRTSDPSSYKDGTYTGSGTGYGGKITVAVTISGGKIASIDVRSHNETSSFFSKAKPVLSRIVSAQSTNVDTVSGATYSSVGLINAVRDALAKAAGGSGTYVPPAMKVPSSTASQGSSTSTPDGTTDSRPDTSARTNGWLDGTYTGIAQGFGGDIKVEVVVKDGRLSSVAILSHDDETPEYFALAASLADKIVSSQNTDVDAVSGATYSSLGIIDAVKNALSKAEPPESPAPSSAQPAPSSEPANPSSEPSSPTGTDDTSSEPTAPPSEGQPGSGQSSTGQSGSQGNPYSDGQSSSQDNPSHDGQSSSQDNPSRDGQSSSQDSSSDEQPGKDPDDSRPAEEGIVYQDGTYTVKVVCHPDEYEDFDAYNLTMDVTIRQDVITAVENLIGDGGWANERYIRKAAEGVVKQLLGRADITGQESIDAVSGATCSSISIAQACARALEKAKR